MVGTDPKLNAGEEEGLLSGGWQDTSTVKDADGQSSPRGGSEVDSGPESYLSSSQIVSEEGYTPIQVNSPPSFDTGTPSANKNLSHPCPPLVSHEHMIKQWVDAQVTYAKTYTSRRVTVYLILAIYCVIPEIVSLVQNGGWMWTLGLLWWLISFCCLLEYHDCKLMRASTLKSVKLAAERMDFWRSAEENSDVLVLDFLDDDKITSPPFYPIPPSILLFTYIEAKQFASLPVFLFSLPYFICLSVGFDKTLYHIEDGWPVAGIMIVELILLIPLYIYANHNPHSHLCGGLNREGAKLQWAWHKEHFQWWGAKAVKDALQPAAISSLKKASGPHPTTSTATAAVLAADVPTLPMDALLQQLRRRMEDENELQELQRKVDEGDLARIVLTALSDSKSSSRKV
ncbi:hypothetical protein IAR50_006606 [Cryptococcus sp. DSM 104548]